MKTIFFGDSITAGEGNFGYSFTYHLTNSINFRNFGVSGTTIGEYSIFPVDGNSLLSMINKHKSTIEDSSKIFLEFGANDVSSIMAGFVSERVVLVSLVKALDAIKQLAPKAEIYFLAISKNPSIIDDFSERMCYYLNNDYFKGFDISIPAKLWATKYKALISAISTKCEVVPLISTEDFLENHTCEDGIHPNNTGHIMIACNLAKYI